MDVGDRQEPQYRSRASDPEHKAKYLKLLLDSLASLERETDPAGGDESAAQKDHRAFRALSFAGDLVGLVAGWALDHALGLALRRLDFVPMQPLQTKQHPDYLAQKAAVDLHIHEDAGGKAYRSDLDPAAARQFLLYVIRANTAGLPLAVAQQAEEALKALEFGERLPLLATTGGKNKKARYRELKLQLRAISFVEYRVANGIRKNKAQEEIAEAFGVSSDAVRNWEYRLRDELGGLTVARTIAFARNAASMDAEDQRNAYRTGGELIDSDRFRNGYGPRSLQRAAQEYHEVVRARPAS